MIFRESEYKTEFLDLLLIADPSVEAINKYKDNCRYYEVVDSQKIVAIMAVIVEQEKAEIKNIAVLDSKQNSGIGSFLLKSFFEKLKKGDDDLKEVVVGTGNSSIGNLAFYQKNNFRMDSIRHNFFINNYNHKIYENGIQCMDMIMLKYCIK